MAGLALAYVAAGRLGLSLDAVSGFATLVWAPTGISLAALLHFGRGLWPAVAVGALVVNLWNGAPLGVAAGIAAGNTLEAVVGALLVERTAQPKLVGGARRCRGPRPRIARALGCSLLVFAPLACSDSAREEPVAEQAASVADARADALERGRVLYDGNCASCHGAGALGDGPLAASLPVAPANILEHLGDHSYEDMVRMVGEGIPPAMPPAAIGSDDVRLVMNYVWTLVPESERGLLRSLQEQAAEAH
jgi:mono/diheme cytochrome c family protein